MREARDELRKDPVKLHDRPIKVKEEDCYLGMLLNERGFKTSVERTIEMRTKRAWSKSGNIKLLVNHPKMRSFGWLKAASTLIKAIIPPILAYSSETWPGIPKKLMVKLEASFKTLSTALWVSQKKTNMRQFCWSLVYQGLNIMLINNR